MCWVRMCGWWFLMLMECCMLMVSILRMIIRWLIRLCSLWSWVFTSLLLSSRVIRASRLSLRGDWRVWWMFLRCKCCWKKCMKSFMLWVVNVIIFCELMMSIVWSLYFRRSGIASICTIGEITTMFVCFLIVWKNFWFYMWSIWVFKWMFCVRNMWLEFCLRVILFMKIWKKWRSRVKSSLATRRFYFVFLMEVMMFLWM